VSICGVSRPRGTPLVFLHCRPTGACWLHERSPSSGACFVTHRYAAYRHTTKSLLSSRSHEFAEVDVCQIPLPVSCRGARLG
jgi:hypothetical protein